MIYAEGTQFILDGKPFHVVGHCEHLRWFEDRPVGPYFERMRAHGENVLRIILDEPPYPHCHWFDDLFSRVCRIARINGIYILPAILFPRGMNLYWDKHSWAKANGGPLNHWWEVYTTEEGKRLAEVTIRQVIDKHDGSWIFAWELVNEMHANHPEWMDELLFVAGKHTSRMLSVSIPNVHTGDASWDTWSHPGLDFISIHAYRSPDPRWCLAYGSVPGRTAAEILSYRTANVYHVVQECARKMSSTKPILDTEVPATPLGFWQRLVTRWPLAFGASEADMEETFFRTGEAYYRAGAAGCLHWGTGSPEGMLSPALMRQQLRLRKLVDGGAST